MGLKLKVVLMSKELARNVFWVSWGVITFFMSLIYFINGEDSGSTLILGSLLEALFALPVACLISYLTLLFGKEEVENDHRRGR